MFEWSLATTIARLRIGRAPLYSVHDSTRQLGALYTARIDEFRQVGLDMSNVKHQQGIEQALSRWAHILADERFDLLEKIASTMAKSKGVNLPPKLSVVCGETEIEHGPDSVSAISRDAAPVKTLQATKLA